MPEVKAVGHVAQPYGRPGCQQPIAPASAEQDQGRSQRGRKRGDIRVGAVFIKQYSCGQDQGDANRRSDAGDRPARLPARVVPPGDEAAGGELPDPRRHQVKGCLWIRPGPVETQAQRGGAYKSQQPGQATATACRQPGQQHQRPHQVELLLDTQRPGMQEQVLVDAAVEIVQPGEVKEEVADPEQCVGGRIQVNQAFKPRQQRSGHQRHDQGHYQKRRQQPLQPAGIEIPEPQLTLLAVLSQQVPRDHVSGDHEKNIDADESAGKWSPARVGEKYEQDCERPQALHVQAIKRRRQ